MAVIGTSVPRKEDPELLTGQARFVDDLTLPGMVWMALVRSPYAHARITGVDVSKALAADGVVAAFSGQDLADDIAAGLPCAWPVTEEIKLPTHWPLARDKARYAGDGVAVVLAESRALAKDAAELVQVDYEPLPAVTDVEAALADGAPIVHDDIGTNRCYDWALSAGDVDRAFADAAVTVRGRYRQNRLIPSAIEPRGVLVQPVPAQGEFTVWSATQIPHILRVLLAMTLGIPEAKLRVIAPEVGGGFGSKLNVYAEEQLAVALARKLGRPVKWIEERSENCQATIHGRDVVQEIDLAATKEGRITAVRVRLTAAMGAYLQLVTPGIPLLGAWLYGGCYGVEAYDFACTGVFTNTTPTDAYRGAGRPEATYAIERAVDALARKLDRDPVELRRLNFISDFPATLASGLTIDAGDFHAALDRALEAAGYDDLRAEQAARRARGDAKQLGIGLSTYVEMCGLAPSRILASLRYGAGGWDAATIRCLPTGAVQVLTGTSPHGQGHETTWSQIAADRLGVDIEAVEVLHGDTAVVPLGMDTYGSRSLAVGGVALYHAADKVIDKARAIVAHQLEAAEQDLEYAEGRFSVKGSPERGMTVTDAAFAAWTAHNLPDGMEPGLEATYVYDPPNFSWPSGTH
ncbi:MAG: xanthine dehydrogenase family protein molybdopterin-binding subunit, partial [Actinomycetota bacterium]